MQVMPTTARDRNVNIPNIHELEPNIHAGVKYMRFMMDEYFKDEPMDNLNKGLMTFASYNAGPGRVRQLRREAERRGITNVRVLCSDAAKPIPGIEPPWWPR